MALADCESERGWFDPRVVPYGPLALDPAAAVFHYAQEMFDGLKAFRGADGKVRFFRLDRHCKRHARRRPNASASRRSTRQLMREAILALVRADARLGAVVARHVAVHPAHLIATEPFLGVRPAKRYLFFVIASPVGAYSGEAFSPARILVEDKYVRAAPGGLGGVKAGANYIASLRAAEDAKARGYAQVLWTDADEHTLSRRGRHHEHGRAHRRRVRDAAARAARILAGVTRDSIITLLREWGFRVNERPIGMEELIARPPARRRCSEMFGCGTAAVITPVGELGWKGEDMVVNGGQPGEVSRRLFDAITGIQYGREPDTHGWMTDARLTAHG